MIAEAHQHVACDFISQMVTHFNEAQACQGQGVTDDAALPDAMRMDLSGDWEAPDMYHALLLDCQRAAHSRVCKRKPTEYFACQSKRARGFSSEGKLRVDGSELEMEDA